MADEEGSRDGIWINGDLFTEDDLTYREQRQMRDLIRELAGNPPDFDAGDAALIDIVPAFVTVVQRRTEPGFSLKQALDLKPSDLRPPDPEKAAAKRRPTKPRG